MSNRKMLINATQTEETRVALTEDGRLIDLDIEIKHKLQKKANIYKAKIARIEPSLNAVFVDYGAERHGFLPAKEIAPEYFANRSEKGQHDLKNMLREGQELMIQIEKEERGNKGAAVTTYITLAGCYLVLMPNNDNAGGISRRIEGDERQSLKNTLNHLNIPKDMSAIIRTAGMGRAPEELEWDLNALLKLWDAIQKAVDTKPAPFLIYQESDVILRSVRDYLRQEISEIILDNEQVYNRVLQHVKQFRPDFVNRLHFYNEETPLFTKYRIEPQIETAYQREVTLPQGGSIVIDHTEALTSIDINSARATRAEHIEATALHTNLEAAEEIARQLRLRDLGGLVVIDFIDMTEPQHKTKVEERLASALKQDRARIQIGQISRFGLLEMSRQRLRPSLAEGIEKTCPRCDGQGVIREVQSLAVSMMRLLKENATKAGTTEILLQLPISVATYLTNEKREDIQHLERQHGIRIMLIPNPYIETPHYDLKRRTTKGTLEASHHFIAKASEQPMEGVIHPPKPSEEPVVKNLNQEAAPTPTSKKQPGLFSRICQALFASNDTEVKRNPIVAPSVEPTEKNAAKGRQPQARRRAGGENKPTRPAETKAPAPRAQTSSSKDKEGAAPKARPQRTQNSGRKPAMEEKNKPQHTARSAEQTAPQQDAVATKPKPAAKPTTHQVLKPTVVTPTVVAPSMPEPAIVPSTVGKLQVEEVVQTTEFSLEQARQRLLKQNAHPIVRVESSKDSLLPPQQGILPLQVEVIEKQH